MLPRSLTYSLKASCSVFAAALIIGCGGGGGGTSNTGDLVPGSKSTTVATSGPDIFLLYPNPLKQSSGAVEVNTLAYATAYYQAIDPGNERNTLARFKAKNGFGTTGAGVIEESIIIGDQRDLGYGRKMTGRQNADGTLAFVVENYLVGGYGPYSPFNLEAAILGEDKWHLGTNGIEFSPGPGGTVSFVKFYTFDPVTGARLNMANLDGRGDKALPTICANCHGGRGDPLTPSGLFPKVMNSASGARGDLAAQLHPFEATSFDFSTLPGYTRSALEGKMKTLNQMVLCSFPLPFGTTKPTGFAEDNCRRVANPNEYQGGEAVLVKTMYGGDGLPKAQSEAQDTYVPESWQTNGQSSLYLNTIAQSCRVCHGLRGTGNQSDISFNDFPAFSQYADRIKAHVIDRGNMPLAKLIYDKYWSTPSINGTMANFLQSQGFSDAALKPGRPVADPGPHRVINSATTQLSAAMSLFSSAYQWEVKSGNATITNPTTPQATFTANGGNGNYTVQLTTGNGTQSSAPVLLTIKVDTSLGWSPDAIRFGDIKNILQNGAGGCTTCHVSTKNPATDTQTPPVFYDNYDRAGTGNPNDATNHQWLYKDVLGRVNLTDFVASSLLRKPSGNHHNGNQRPGFNTSLPPGDPGRADYDKVLAWILNGAPL
jgi:mono/diheme cytochrome c family protein